MCYAIPGKIKEINGNTVTVDYFGQHKIARNDFYHDLKLGDYIYAQGGFVIQKVSTQEALPVLETWQEFFVKLQDLDLRLARQPKNLYQTANSIRQKRLGNSCCIHGIIEFSNFCTNNCLYCGIRKDNAKLARYRMGIEEIISTVEFAVRRLNFKALVLQSGEDLWYDEKKLVSIVKEIMKRFPVLLIMSIGQRGIEIYRKLYEAGVRGVLLRFETSNLRIYERCRPGSSLPKHLDLIKDLKEMGYLLFTGFLIGLPGQTEEDILNDIKLTGSLNPDMFSFGPFIPHPNTPLKDERPVQLDVVLTAIARTRIMYPESRILVTTALETLDKLNGARQGLLSGANSLMINLTPSKYRRLYEIYPNRAGIEEATEQRIGSVIKLLQSLGRAPTDLGI